MEDNFRQVSPSKEESDDEDGGVDLGDGTSAVSEAEQGEHLSDQVMQDRSDEGRIPTLNAGGFDWTAGILDNAFEQPDEASSDEGSDDLPKKHRRKPVIKVDMTGELDTNGPQSISDFERLLLGQPDSSRLWIEYMAFQTKLGELPRAREVAERALRTIAIREQTEKMNIWIALFNLENEYGSDDTMEDTFRRACQYNDPQELHERLTSIYIQSGKHVVSQFQSLYSLDAANNQIRKPMNFSKPLLRNSRNLLTCGTIMPTSYTKPCLHQIVPGSCYLVLYKLYLHTHTSSSL
jgi:rRNA biogenesis protein RRP5